MTVNHQDTIRFQIPGLTVTTQEIRGDRCTFPLDTLMEARVAKNKYKDDPIGPKLMTVAVFVFAIGFGIYSVVTSGEEPSPTGLLISGLLSTGSIVLFLVGLIAQVVHWVNRKRFVVLAQTSMGGIIVYATNQRHEAEVVAQALRHAIKQPDMANIDE